MRRFLLLFLCFVFTPFTAQAAVTLNATGTAQSTASGTSLNYTGLTVAAGANTVLVIECFFNANVSGVTVTWDSGATDQAMTQLRVQQQQSSARYNYLFGLIAPTAGNKTAAVAWTTTTFGACNGIAFDGADQAAIATTFTDGVGASNQATTATITITTANGDATVSNASRSGALTSPSQTQFTDNVGSSGHYAQYALSTGTSDVHSWATASQDNGLQGIRVNQVSGGGGGDNVGFFGRRMAVQ